MKTTIRLAVLIVTIFFLAVSMANAADAEKVAEKTQDPKARALLDEAKEKLRSLNSLVFDYQMDVGPSAPTRYFERQSEVMLERPNRFRIDRIDALIEERQLRAVSDGRTITEYNRSQYVAYKKPVRAENFFLGHNFLVQFFYDPKIISFDPSDAIWGRPISLFSGNTAAYDRNVDIQYLGSRLLQGKRYDIVEIKYNTDNNDIRQQIYIGEDKLIYQVDGYFGTNNIRSQKFRNFRINADIAAETWSDLSGIPEKMPVVDSDPVRMGAEAPDFTLPGYDGGEFTLKKVLKDKKGVYIAAINGMVGLNRRNPDLVLGQMKLLQEMKDKFEPQGLMVMAVVGDSQLTPDLVDEMKLNGLPDVSRFDYPIVIDIDLERGIQGSAYRNFSLKGRKHLLLDSDGKVVFASRGYQDVDKQAFYQALAQIGFEVSPADLEE